MDKGGGTVLIAGNASWPGIGHNSVYTFEGRDWFVAHAYDARRSRLVQAQGARAHVERRRLADAGPDTDPLFRS